MTSYAHRNGSLFTVSEAGQETFLTDEAAGGLLSMWSRIAADPLEDRVYRRHAQALADSLRAALSERDTPRPDHPEDALFERRLMETA